MALHQVLDTAELLENILLHLPGKTVFGVARVCRSWRDIINGSPSIQQALFLRPPSEDHSTWLIDGGHDKIRKLDGPCCALKPTLDYITRPIIINDIVLSHRRMDIFLRAKESCDADFSFRTNLSRYTSESSCRFMFISSPPVQYAQLHWHASDMSEADREEDDGSHYISIYKPGGITFGDILRAYYVDSFSGPMSTAPNRIVVPKAIITPPELFQQVNRHGKYQQSPVGRMLYHTPSRKEILAHLDPGDLLPLRRVDRRFKLTIDNWLAEHMFREPMHGPRRFALIDCSRGLVGLLGRDAMVHSAEAFISAALGGSKRFLVREVYELNTMVVRVDGNSSGDVIKQAQQKFTELHFKIAGNEPSPDSYFYSMYVTRPVSHHLAVVKDGMRFRVSGSDVASLARSYRGPGPFPWDGIRIPSGVVPSDEDWSAMADRQSMTIEDVLSYIRSQALKLNFDLPYLLSQL